MRNIQSNINTIEDSSDLCQQSFSLFSLPFQYNTYLTSSFPVKAAALAKGELLCARLRLLCCLFVLYELGLMASNSCFSKSTLAEPGPNSFILFSRDIRNNSNFWLDSDKLD